MAAPGDRQHFPPRDNPDDGIEGLVPEKDDNSMGVAGVIALLIFLVVVVLPLCILIGKNLWGAALG